MIETTRTPNNMVICFALAAEGSYLIMGLNECRHGEPSPDGIDENSRCLPVEGKEVRMDLNSFSRLTKIWSGSF